MITTEQQGKHINRNWVVRGNTVSSKEVKRGNFEHKRAHLPPVYGETENDFQCKWGTDADYQFKRNIDTDHRCMRGTVTNH